MNAAASLLVNLNALRVLKVDRASKLPFSTVLNASIGLLLIACLAVRAGVGFVRVARVCAQEELRGACTTR